MSDYPDPDEEFELMYGDELELLKDQENDPPPLRKSRRSLDFSSASDTQPEKNSQNVASSSTCNSLSQQGTPDLFPNESDLGENNTNLHNGVTCSVSNSQSNKRTVEELFGDIDDLDNMFLDEQFPDPKKQKRDEHEEKLALIERIVELRKLSKEKNSITNLKKDRVAFESDRDKYNLSYGVPKYPFIGVTRFDKERVYVRFHSEEYEKEEAQRVVKECTFKGVLGDGIKELWEKAQQLINNQIDKDSEMDSINMESEQPDDSTELWVDLYKPRRYLELLSDESTNRVMLRWIKLWDKVVFNRKPKIRPPKPEDTKKPFFKFHELDTNLDEQGRPKNKVALLCGTPGLGKTTLAHMVARHAGYNVIEINASDDRSTDSFKTALENATQMRSVLDREKRPNCLVFDEIDGAPQSSIDFLVKFVQGTAASKLKKGKPQKQLILKRPIICICNDVYVPSLRALRQIAFVINFPAVSSARLAERLMEIARRQQIKTDLGAMMALAEKSNNDVRSCLSVLHFFKAQGKAVTLSDVYKSSIGQKDIQKGLFAVWQDIFQTKRIKHNEKLDAGSDLKARMENILHTVSSFGDYERVSQGVFENYPFIKLKDSTLSGICQCMEWFLFSDLVTKQIYSQQNYSLSPYLQYAFVIWHFVFATSQNQRLNYPLAGIEAKQKENHRRALVAEVLRGLPPRVRPYCHRLSLTLDILPLLIIIIVPQFRPVSLHLYSKEEKENMLNVVNIMIDYNLNYIQERLPSGTFSFNLEPNIEEVVTFTKETSISRKPLSYSNKQLIAREVDLEKVRKFEKAKSEISESANYEKNVPNNAKKTQFDHNRSETEGIIFQKQNEMLPNHLQTLKAKSVGASKSAPRKDFFGRVIEKTSPKEKAAGPQLDGDILFRYKEGYSNAVRKKVTIDSMM